MKRARGQGEKGAGTVLVLGVAGAGLFMIAMSGLLGQVMVARHRAQAAADLGALAGASALSAEQAGTPAADSFGGLPPGRFGMDRNQSAACGVAARVALANSARLDHCVPSTDGSVVVQASVAVARGGWRARAGSLGSP